MQDDEGDPEADQQVGDVEAESDDGAGDNGEAYVSASAGVCAVGDEPLSNAAQRSPHEPASQFPPRR